MNFSGINFLAVGVSAVVCMILGFLWYSPFLAGRPWMIAMGMNPEDKEAIKKMQQGAGMLYAISFVASLVSALVLAKLITVTNVRNVFLGMKLAGAIWLAFVATVQLTGNLFTKKPIKLFFIDTGYQLLCYLAMGAILAKWR